MTRNFTICIFLLLGWFSAKADHITGGEMYYSFTGIVNNMYQYNVHMKLFMRCNSGRQFNNPSKVSIYSRADNSLVTQLDATLSRRETIRISDPNPCITNPPEVCYEVGFFDFTVSLPASSAGFYIVSQVNFRINTISNLSSGYSQVGATYVAEIPGTNAAANGPQNNSAVFTGSDLVIICGNNPFSYSFAAEDTDGDQLSYSFCDAYQSGTSGVNAPIPPPPYQPVPYGQNFSGQSPLGPNVQINPTTGLITGVAPSAGAYVVTVCVKEIRDGKVIATQRKDLQINIAPCEIAAAILPPEYQLCKSTKTIQLTNQSTSPLINSYYWEITDRAGSIIFTSQAPTPAHTFADTGLYSVKLVINRNQGCSDSTASIARVYPDFMPAFSFSGLCITKPTRFFDASTTVYGAINKWQWDFGENTVTNDNASIPNPVYTYPLVGIKNAKLTITNSNGCRDSLIKPITIFDKPTIQFNFKDTLICNKDSVKLLASGSGTFSWTPQQNMLNANTPSPTVFPQSNKWYVAQLNDDGCINKDSVLVRVTDKVNLGVMNDTTICGGDTIQLRTHSDAFRYSWTPAGQVLDPTSANPIVLTATSTLYNVSAFIGSCVASKNIHVITIPYPTVNAGPDTTICYDTELILKGRSDGSIFLWRPAQTLTNFTTLTPVAHPLKTISYTLLAYDTKGCPKAAADDITVTVLPPILAYAGNDTSVIIGQPLQLNASGGDEYFWSPSTGLSAVDVSNPIAIFTRVFDNLPYLVKVFNNNGCVDSASINVKVYATIPSIFVPSAFTPNSDGKNDYLRPIAVGIKQIEYFTVFNRWGQRIFSTNMNGMGWDGKINGKPQGSGTYVWLVKAVDYTGKPYLQKGTVTLIR